MELMAIYAEYHFPKQYPQLFDKMEDMSNVKHNNFLYAKNR